MFIKVNTITTIMDEVYNRELYWTGKDFEVSGKLAKNFPVITPDLLNAAVAYVNDRLSADEATLYVVATKSQSI